MGGTSDVTDEPADATPVDLRGDRWREFVGHQDERGLQFVRGIGEDVGSGTEVSLQATHDIREAGRSISPDPRLPASCWTNSKCRSTGTHDST